MQFVPWERLLLQNAAKMKPIAIQLAAKTEIVQLSQRLPQLQYNIGARLGAIGMKATDKWTGDPALIPKPGAELYITNKMPVVLNALLNATVSASLASSFAPRLAGDRLIYDYLISGGFVDAATRKIAVPLVLPDFGAAVLPDLAAIRADSEAMSTFRSVVRDASAAPENEAIDTIRERLAEAAARAREDASLLKAVGARTVQFGLTSFGSALAGYALGGNPAVGVAAGAVGFLASVLQPVFSPERASKVSRAELITRIGRRL
jgi:hypothetical protein